MSLSFLLLKNTGRSQCHSKEFIHFFYKNKIFKNNFQNTFKNYILINNFQIKNNKIQYNFIFTLNNMQRSYVSKILISIIFKMIIIPGTLF
jgi:hypothetical protein